jgi:hypothetical protein
MGERLHRTPKYILLSHFTLNLQANLFLYELISGLEQSVIIGVGFVLENLLVVWEGMEWDEKLWSRNPINKNRL